MRAPSWIARGSPPGIIASPTPTLDSIAVFPGPIGPLAVSTDALERLGEHDAIESRRCHDPLALIRRMICLGLNGAVVPSVHEPANPLVDPGCADPLRADDALAPTFAAWAVASGNPLPHRRGMTWQQRAEAAEAELDHLRAGRAWRVASALSTLAHALPTHRQGR
ncbi:MAG: hypothetical protein IH985_09600 [Planctomycetes bacterium]|nr:hypothetical protein [Planctomycetota bacterium]